MAGIQTGIKVPANRRQELRYFAMQYWDYKRKIAEVSYLKSVNGPGSVITIRDKYVFRPSDVERVAMETARYSEYVRQIESAVQPLDLTLTEVLENLKRDVRKGQMMGFYWRLDKLHT